MGSSFCRFACGIPDEEMGSTEFYDGVTAFTYPV
jgi:hypothetical protein